MVLSLVGPRGSEGHVDRNIVDVSQSPDAAQSSKCGYSTEPMPEASKVYRNARSYHTRATPKESKKKPVSIATTIGPGSCDAFGIDTV